MFMIIYHDIHTCMLEFDSTEFDLTTCDSDFPILVQVFKKYIWAENTYFMNHIEWTEYNIMVINPANKYQIIWQCQNFKKNLIDDL